MTRVTGSRNVLSFLSVFAIGGLVGIVFGLMVAPQSGKALRKKLQEAGVEYIGEVDRRLEDLGFITRKAALGFSQELDLRTRLMRP